jgi:cell division septum initiation protein DivIVA
MVMEVHDKIAEIVALVDSARTMPMSSTAMVNKQQVLTLLDEVREGLPANLQAAEAVLGQREALLIEARGNAERVLANAQAEQARLVADHTVTQAARIEAEEILRQAREQAENIRSDADDYVDAKLARLEISAARIVETVRDGREQLRHPTAYEELSQRRNGHPVVVPELDGAQAGVIDDYVPGTDLQAERFGPEEDAADDDRSADQHGPHDAETHQLKTGLG